LTGWIVEAALLDAFHERARVSLIEVPHLAFDQIA
jgi:hypothetical protein